ncbi:MAG TPA: sugar ABC transporter permease [Rectinemataceae bacterium]|nr:sugar ABC transporter permease [Rectinemataceae bacterium]
MTVLGKRIARGVEFAALTLPAVAAIVVVVMVPFGMSVVNSFMKWNGLDKKPVFIGLANYVELFTDDPNLIAALIFTLFFTVAMVVLTNVIALLLALALNQPLRGRNLLRAAFYVPNIISLIVIGYIWRFIFSKGFDSMYAATGFAPLNLSWLGDPKLAFASTVFVSVWQAVGFYLVIYIAGLQTIPYDIVEAATLDGAGPIRRFFDVTLPLLMPSVTVAVFYSLSNALKTFDVIFSLTYGGPGTATTSIALDIYKTAFSDSRFGYGMAKSVVLFLLILVVGLLQIGFFKKREVES